MSGETSASESGWTVDTLHAHLVGLIGAQESAATALLEAMDLRYQQRFDAQQKALEAALLAAEKAVQAALTAADRAVAKAESASEKRFESVNEFRAQLADQTRTLMPRTEAEIRFTALNVEIGNLKRSNEREVGNRTGRSDVTGYLVGVGGLIVAIVAAIIAVYLGTR